MIGGGVSGLTAAHVLHHHDDVTLFEADDRLGGHAHTHHLPGPDGGPLGVDSGFIVHNRRTYPHLLRLFDELDVATRPTEMSLSVSCAGCGLEYAGARGLRALWPNRSRAGVDYLRMLGDLPRFHRAANRLLRTARRLGGKRDTVGPTLGAFVEHHRFSPYFTAHFLLPLVSAVWSCSAGTALEYPAHHLFTFLEHHGMLGIWGSPRWRTVVGGSHTYVERVAENLHSVRTGTPVRGVARGDRGVRVRTDDPRDADGLARAQERKIDRLLDSARVGEDTELLEIGTGWGELAVRAARRGARVTSITLSTEQRDLARARVAEAGVADRVEVRLCDYRDATGSYDAVVSCEMIEAVGERYWTAYVTALDRLTRPGGRVALQCITMEHAMMRASRGSYTWMHKYVFPGGLIPSVTALRRELSAHTRLRVTDRHAFGRDYADTLGVWRRTFVDALDQVREPGFDPVFHRMWTFYLAYCEAGFRSAIIDVEQITLERPT